MKTPSMFINYVQIWVLPFSLLLFSCSPPLYKVVAVASQAEIEERVNSGSDINKMNEDGRTPLHIAATRTDIELTSLLLKHGANPNIKNNWGGIPLHEACLSQNVNAVRELLKAGSHVDEKENSGLTPLYLTIMLPSRWFTYNRASDKPQVNQQIVRMLLDGGADPTVAPSGYLPLIVEASGYANKQTIQDLLDAGADLKVTSKQGETSLSIALKSKNKDIVQLLLKEGAQPDSMVQYEVALFVEHKGDQITQCELTLKRENIIATLINRPDYADRASLFQGIKLTPSDSLLFDEGVCRKLIPIWENRRAKLIIGDVKEDLILALLLGGSERSFSTNVNGQLIRVETYKQTLTIEKLKTYLSLVSREGLRNAGVPEDLLSHFPDNPLPKSEQK